MILYIFQRKIYYGIYSVLWKMSRIDCPKSWNTSDMNRMKKKKYDDGKSRIVSWFYTIYCCIIICYPEEMMRGKYTQMVPLVVAASVQSSNYDHSRVISSFVPTSISTRYPNSFVRPPPPLLLVSVKHPFPRKETNIYVENSKSRFMDFRNLLNNNNKKKKNKKVLDDNNSVVETNDKDSTNETENKVTSVATLEPPPIIDDISENNSTNTNNSTKDISSSDGIMTSEDSKNNNVTNINGDKSKQLSFTDVFSSYPLLPSAKDFSKDKAKNPTSQNNRKKQNSKKNNNEKIYSKAIRDNSLVLNKNITNDQVSFLTYEDLDRILQERGLMNNNNNNNGFLQLSSSSGYSTSYNSNGQQAQNTYSKSKSEKNYKKVGIPQKTTVVSMEYILRGTIIASSTLFTLIGVTLYPNLWLMSAVVGAFYGQTIPIVDEQELKEYYFKRNRNIAADNDDQETKKETLLFHQMFLQKIGWRLARTYLTCKDACQALWFLYRTGQLSLEYLKTYETLDDKFRLTDKMNAWNARFVEGKRNFDEWEQQNEISRKVLAALRTAWFVEEKKNQKNKYSKYRIVRYVQSAAKYCKQFFRTLQDQINQMLTNISSKESQSLVEERFLAAVGAIALVQVISVLFSASPFIASSLAAIAAFIAYPNYVDYINSNSNSNSNKKDHISKESDQIAVSLESPFPFLKTLFQPQDRAINKSAKKDEKVPASNFNFFVLPNGSKRWYRTGKSLFTASTTSPVTGDKNSIPDKKNKNGRKIGWKWWEK